MSFNSEMTNLADAIRAKSGTEGKLSISGMTTAVNNITTGSDIDLAGVTVTADKMLYGIVAIGATGEKVTGNIPTVAAFGDGEKVTVPAGFIEEEQTFLVGGGGYDTSAVTVTADTMLAGKIAVGKTGETITGNIATVTPNLSGRTFTVAKGYVAENFEASVPEATVTETESKVTISTGYVSTELSYDLGGGGIDTTTSVPPSAADVRLGKEFWANGAKYTGTMPDALVTVEDNGDGENKLTISAGFLENDFELEYNTSAVVYLPFVTATAADIREGKVGADNEGNPVYGTLVVGGDTPAPASGLSVVKVAEYTPYSPAFNGITEIEVSNIGYIGNQDEDWGQDYSEANGKYIVTEDTYYETDEKKRVYKHESKNYWIMFYDDSEWGNWGYNYWVITPYEGDSEPYSAVVCVEESNFTTGVSEWYNMEYDTPVDVGIATTITDNPEQPMSLECCSVSYDNDKAEWSFGTEIINLNGFEQEPKVGEIYAVNEMKLIGTTIGVDPNSPWKSPKDLTGNRERCDFFVDQSSYYNEETLAYRAFDKKENLGNWSSNTYNSRDGSSEEWISITIPYKRVVNYIKLVSAGWNNGCQPASFVWEGSPDGGETWEPLLSVEKLTKDWWNSPAVGTPHEWTVETNKGYRYYRLRMTAKTEGSSFNIQTMEIGYK